MFLQRIIATPSYGTNCYLYSPDNSGLWIIDPGAEGFSVVQKARALAIPVKGILLTHSHWDHIMGLPSVHEAWPEASILIHREEQSALGAEGGRRQAEMVSYFDPAFLEKYGKAFGTLPEATGTFTDGDMVADSTLRVIHTPGHSPGSVCLYNAVENILFSGDTLFYGSIGRSDLPGGNGQILQESLEKLSGLPPQTKVFPGHGSSTTILQEKNDNPWFQY